jgi:adenine/guanine phosphoribosyltransferase-like PRPP-binding protein
MIYHNGGNNFNGLEQEVRKTCANLRPHLDKFDSIVVQGVSGQCVGFPVALRLNKPILVLRKADEDTHSYAGGSLINANASGKRVLFLDDFVSSGDTFERCKTAVEASRGGPFIVGSYQYTHHTLNFAAAGEDLAAPAEIPF